MLSKDQQSFRNLYFEYISNHGAASVASLNVESTVASIESTVLCTFSLYWLFNVIK